MDQDKINQIVAYAIAIITGIIAFFRGGQNRPPSEPPPPSSDSDSAELARLRELQQQDHDRRVDLELKAIRADFEMAIKSLKESVHHRMDGIAEQNRDFERRVSVAETKLAVIEDRQNRRR